MDETALRVLWIAPLRVPAFEALKPSGQALHVTPCEAADLTRWLADDGFDVLVAPADPADAPDAADIPDIADIADTAGAAGTGAAAWPACTDAIAVVLLHGHVAPDVRAGWISAGAQDAMTLADLHSAEGVFRLRAAAQRHRLRVATRQAFATDVQTGLPHQGQLLEHMSHLLALREREPAPMALLVLRIEGLATTALRLGADKAGALRRKAAVRLRAGVRASDVVASLADDSFAVLLSSIDMPADAARVAAKLQASLSQPFRLAGEEVALASALGIAASPADGSQPAVLLRRAAGLAASAAAVGRAGFANRVEGGTMPGAANDD